MKQSHKTLLIWVLLLVMFFWIYRAFAVTAPGPFVPGVGLGIVTGLVGGAVLIGAVAKVVRDGKRAGRIVLGVIYLVLPGAAIACGIGVAPGFGLGIGGVDAVFGAWLCALLVRNVLDNRFLVAFRTLARAPGPLPAPVLRRVARARPVVALNCAHELTLAGRAAEAEPIARAAAGQASDERAFRGVILVGARLELGDLAGARAAIDEIRPVAIAELPPVLDASVRAASGEAAAVAAELAAPAPAAIPPWLVTMRALVRADACAASGDRASAEQIVRELAVTDARLVDRLAGSNRPVAAIATSLARGVATGPFR